MVTGVLMEMRITKQSYIFSIFDSFYSFIILYSFFIHYQYVLWLKTGEFESQSPWINQGGDFYDLNIDA